MGSSSSTIEYSDNTKPHKPGNDIHHWNYGPDHGPQHWHKEYPCAGGLHQSPINIVTNEAHYTNLKFDKMVIAYGQHFIGELKNTGHSFQLCNKDEKNCNFVTVFLQI